MRWTRIEGYVYSLISGERCLGGVSIAWDGRKKVRRVRQKQNFDLFAGTLGMTLFYLSW